MVTTRIRAAQPTQVAALLGFIWPIWGEIEVTYLWHVVSTSVSDVDFAKHGVLSVLSLCYYRSQLLRHLTPEDTSGERLLSSRE